MKIAMLTNSYKPFVAGVPISIERLSDALKRQGHEVVIFAPDYDGQEADEAVVRYGALLRNVAGGFSVPNCFDPVIEKRFKEEDFDVIHVHHPMMMGNVARRLSGKYGIPLVFTYHTRYEQYLHYIGLSGLKRLMPEYIRYCTAKCDIVIAPTPLMKEYLEEINVKPQVRVLPTGLTADSYVPDEAEASKIRTRLLQNRKYLFCCVARLAKEKNIEFLIRSMKERKEKCGSDFKLVLVGNGPERKCLEKLAKELALEEEIIFAGAVSNKEVKNYCYASDLFLFASQTETQGIVLAESMAAGTPVLAVRGTGTEDIVINGKNGYMTQPSESEFASKIEDILEKKELPVLSLGARETSEKFNSDHVAEEAAAVYREAIKIRSCSNSSVIGCMTGESCLQK